MPLNAYYQIGGDIGVSGNADTYSSPFSPSPLAYSNSPPPASNPPPPASNPPPLCRRQIKKSMIFHPPRLNNYY